MSGGMLPWTTRNRMQNGLLQMPDDVKTDTKNVVAKMHDSILTHRLCGEDCRECEVRCNFGIEAMRRGLNTQKQDTTQRRRGRKTLPKVHE